MAVSPLAASHWVLSMVSDCITGNREPVHGLAARLAISKPGS